MIESTHDKYGGVTTYRMSAVVFWGWLPMLVGVSAFTAHLGWWMAGKLVQP